MLMPEYNRKYLGLLMNIIEQKAAIMAIPVVLVNDNKATNNAAASQCLDEGLSTLRIDREIYSKHIKRNSLHNPCEKIIEPGKKANINGITELTDMFFVQVYNQAPMSMNPSSRKLIDIWEASTGVFESTPRRPIITGYKGGK